jgi:para-nitrobenzyl esterase
VRRKVRFLLGVLLALATAALGLLPASAYAASGGTGAAGGTPVVRTDRGAVGGATSDGVERFLGIPYAAPPTGALRWRPPQPARPWPGVRDATAFGSSCPALASTNGPRSEDEDCLFVNVWRPAGASAGERPLPVHVFIHGGGLVNGSGTQMDESSLVRQTGVIGVSLNYRLGVFGFLGLPGLAAEGGGDTGDYGFQDQQAALRWVQRNIAAFGGDPRQVTIDGESAGGWSVCGHLVAPGSRGLFSRAMIQSGSCHSIPLSQAESNGAAYAEQAGCAQTEQSALLACLRAEPAGHLLDASGSFSPAFVHGTPTFPIGNRQALDTGAFARVPVLVGANRDEGRTFAAGYIGAGEDAYTSFVDGIAGDRADEVLARYPWPANPDRFTAAYLIGAIMTDSGVVAGIGGCGLQATVEDLARHTTTYSYEFDHRTGPGLTQIPGYVWGAGHAAELAYIWPSFDNGTPIAPLFNAAERQLSREMTRYWGAFTAHGRPQVGGQAPWPSYRAGAGRMISLRAGGQSTDISAARFAAEHQCAFWDTMPVTQNLS